MDAEISSIMQKYSELPVVAPDTYEVPHTILDYKERMKANDRVSIFDSDVYTFGGPSGGESDEEDKTSSDDLSDHNKLSFEHEPVIKVSCGRGRGLLGKELRPGGFSMNDNDIRKDLRKIAPLGYGNEITELTLKANKAAKSDKNNSLIKLPNGISRSNCNQAQQTQHLTMSEEENASPLPMSTLLQINKENRDKAYREFLEKKEQQMWNEKMATERKIKELLEEDRRNQEKLQADLERRCGVLAGTGWRSQSDSLNRGLPWRQPYCSGSKLNIKSTTDFPPLSSGKKD